MLVGQHWARAGLTADADVAACVQLVGGHTHDTQEVPGLSTAHVAEGVVLDQAAGTTLDTWGGVGYVCVWGVNTVMVTVVVMLMSLD